MRRGYTMMEVLMVIGIVVVLSALSIPSYQAIKVRVDLNDATQETVSAIRNAQNMAATSVATAGGVPHKITFTKSVATLSYFDSYQIDSGAIKKIERKVEYVVTPPASNPIEFVRLTGKPTSGTDTIVTLTNPGGSKKITVSPNGTVVITNS